ncbi:MAG TPA: hypothetical protein VI816_02650 [Candidatus Bathyarchaeia archaeon]|nr:hypothetical protein [Candidatus Bathyarchaeia archaeon]
MNRKGVSYQVLIFSTQWMLMLIGLGLLSQNIAPAKILDPNFPFGRYFDASIKALVALFLSVVWLFLWDRQVRALFYRKKPTG